MTPDSEGLIKLFSYYRDAETRGCSLLMRMMQRVDDPEAQVLFSRHVDDETRHAWLWTKRIKDEGGLPVPVPDGYQRRLGLGLGIPRTIIDLFALTVIVEQRAEARYKEHLASPLCDDKTRDVLNAVTKDETWHIAWMEEWMLKMAREAGEEQKVKDTLARYRTVEKEVFEEIKADEREWLGFSFSDVPAEQAPQPAAV